MRKTKLAISLVVIVAAILFAGNGDLYAGANVENPWLTQLAPRGSTPWTGNLVITARIANVQELPANGLPSDAMPTISDQYKDFVVKIEFFVRLENNKKGWKTFSGLAKYTLESPEPPGEYYLFYLLSDYANKRIGEALNKFLADRVYPNLPGNVTGAKGVITSVTEAWQNANDQLKLVDGYESLQPETPLYFNAKITVATYY
jgi:hypothetical protein